MQNYEAYRAERMDFLKTDKWKPILDVLSKVGRKNDQEGLKWLNERVLRVCVQMKIYDQKSDLYNFNFQEDSQEGLKAVKKLIELNKIRPERISLDFANAIIALKSKGITLNCKSTITSQELFSEILNGMEKSLTAQNKSNEANSRKNRPRNIVHGGTARPIKEGERVRVQNPGRNSFFFHLAFIFKLYDLKKYEITWGDTMPNEGRPHYAMIADIYGILGDGLQSTSPEAVKKTVDIMIEKKHMIIAFY